MKQFDGVMGLKIIMVLALIFVGAALFYNSGKSCDTQIKLIVADMPVVDNVTVGNMSLLGIKYECLRFCIETFQYQETYDQKSCYEQCQALGGTD